MIERHACMPVNYDGGYRSEVYVGLESPGDAGSEIEMARIESDPGRQSMRVDADSVQLVMESIIRTTTADRLDIEKLESEEKNEHPSTRENDAFEGDDTESRRTHRSSLNSRVRTER
jgi:hypothetical protein